MPKVSSLLPQPPQKILHPVGAGKYYPLETFHIPEGFIYLPVTSGGRNFNSGEFYYLRSLSLQLPAEFAGLCPSPGNNDFFS